MYVIETGKRVFITKLKTIAKNMLAASNGHDENEDSEATDQGLLLKAISLVAKDGVKEEAPNVDVMTVLEKNGLSNMFPVEVWPETDSTRQLALWVKNKRKHDGENAFVYADLKRCVASFFLVCPHAFLVYRFLPPSCPEWVAADECTEEPSKKKDRRLDFAWWLVAFDRYTISAIATGQLSIVDCMLHKQIVIEVAAASYGESRGPWLAVLYDELCR